MVRLGSIARNVVGHYNRRLWPRRSRVRLVAAVIRIALVENRVVDDEIGVLVSWKQAMLEFGKAVKPSEKKEREEQQGEQRIPSGRARRP